MSDSNSLEDKDYLTRTLGEMVAAAANATPSADEYAPALQGDYLHGMLWDLLAYVTMSAAGVALWSAAAPLLAAEHDYDRAAVMNEFLTTLAPRVPGLAKKHFEDELERLPRGVQNLLFETPGVLLDTPPDH